MGPLKNGNYPNRNSSGENENCLVYCDSCDARVRLRLGAGVRFLSHLSRRLTGELIVYPCSGVRCRRLSFAISKIFSSETTWPVKAKLHVEHPKEGETKVCINSPGHMTKMAATAINRKNL